MSIAQGIVDACVEHAGGCRVIRVTVEIGALSCVMHDALRFSYEIAAAGTPLEGAALEIIGVPARTRCRDCGTAFDMNDILSRCVCGSVNFDPPVGGDELQIKSMEILEAA